MYRGQFFRRDARAAQPYFEADATRFDHRSDGRLGRLHVCRPRPRWDGTLHMHLQQGLRRLPGVDIILPRI